MTPTATESAKPLKLGDVPVSEIELHGHRVTYREVGEGPVIVLIHGVTGEMSTWDPVLPWLADRFTIVTPDLLGHGLSAKPRGDYSLGAFASGIRDLLGALGHFHVTVVGHSLGGGIAMQMAYQFPEHCQRLVLVSSGGLGSDVSVALRAATLPGSGLVLPLIAHDSLIRAGRMVGRWLGSVGIHPSPDRMEILRGYASLSDPEARSAFIHTMRAVIDPWGQRVSARDRLYLTAQMPAMVSGAGRTGSFPPSTESGPTGRCRAAAWRSSRTPATSPMSASPGALPGPWATSSSRPSPPSSPTSRCRKYCCSALTAFADPIAFPIRTVVV